MSCRQCERCGARWINGVHYWATGKVGSDLDLAGLVCDVVRDPRCQNRLRGMGHEGDTWAKRRAFIDGAADAMQRTVKRLEQET
jgi:hypothetical protein